MLQYIINTTAIWLLGLIIFDLFLRREPYHNYNRLYLMVILLAGVLVPMWSWNDDSVIYATNISRPVAEQTAAVREAIVAGSEQQLIGWEQWLQIIYSSGVAICTLLLLKDIIVIIRLYSAGIKSKNGVWTIVETNKAVSPFSAFRFIFISNRDNYTEEELRMILAHEEQHGHLLHFIDILITKLMSILFWFNPLVYILEKRLLMVHEYQADSIIKTNVEIYGRFLVEQSVLGTAPTLAHSFIRSPLKKRILMLTRKTTTLARGKQLLIAPVIFITMLCCTQNAFSFDEPKRDGNKVTYKGNVIEFGDKRPDDTTEVVNSVTGEPNIVITRYEPAPLTLNGETIYRPPAGRNDPRYVNVATKGSELTGGILKKYLLDNMKKELEKLGDGEYIFDLQFLVLDNKGKIAYFEIGNLSKVVSKNGSTIWAPLDEDLKKRLSKKISSLMNKMPVYEPATKDGKKVAIMIDDRDILEPIKIKNGKLESL